MKATQVKVVDLYKISVVFDDGVSGTVDLNDLVQQGIFKELKNDSLFYNVSTDGYAISWSDDLEIDAINLYAKITNKRPEDLIQKHYQYASNK